MNINPLMQGKSGGDVVTTKSGKMTTAYLKDSDSYGYCALKIDSAEEVIETVEVLNQGSGGTAYPHSFIIKKDGSFSGQIPASNWPNMGNKILVADMLNAAGVSIDDANIILLSCRGYNNRVVSLTIS